MSETPRRKSGADVLGIAAIVAAAAPAVVSPVPAQPQCEAKFPVGGERCELPMGHDGEHFGHSLFEPSRGTGMFWGKRNLGQCEGPARIFEMPLSAVWPTADDAHAVRVALDNYANLIPKMFDGQGRRNLDVSERDHLRHVERLDAARAALARLSSGRTTAGEGERDDSGRKELRCDRCDRPPFVSSLRVGNPCACGGRYRLFPALYDAFVDGPPASSRPRDGELEACEWGCGDPPHAQRQCRARSRDGVEHESHNVALGLDSILNSEGWTGCKHGRESGPCPECSAARRADSEPTDSEAFYRGMCAAMLLVHEHGQEKLLDEIVRTTDLDALIRAADKSDPLRPVLLSMRASTETGGSQ